MDFTRWFWKYGYVIVPLILALVWFLNSEKFQTRDKVNPEVFAHFKDIERQCQQESFGNHSVNCEKIENHNKDCLKISVSCDSRSYYEFLQGLGYSLPPYLLE